MYPKTMISISVAALAIGLFMPSNSEYRILLQFLVCASAVLIVLHSVRAQAEYLWAGAFCCVAFVYNPIVPVALPSRELSELDLACMALFLVYHRVCKAKPRVSTASIAGHSPGPRAL